MRVVTDCMSYHGMSGKEDYLNCSVSKEKIESGCNYGVSERNAVEQTADFASKTKQTSEMYIASSQGLKSFIHDFFAGLLILDTMLFHKTQDFGRMD